MSDFDLDDIPGAPSYMEYTCDNCGREIDDGHCPYCDFGYREGKDENGVYYY